MGDYDFRALNDKEFEALCADLLGAASNSRFERFKAGRDGGVDGRYFSDDGGEVILQCKHWINTPVRDLIAKLRVDERPKIDKLRPIRYLIAVSNNLSRKDKEKISAALSPHVKCHSDVYGNEDLNDLLKIYPALEERHYKLWLQSAAVLSHVFNASILGRSEFSVSQIHHHSRKYVITANHDLAVKKLDNLGVVVITGEPGIGKTTLAEHLCLNYVAKGHRFIQVLDDIKEAEAVFSDEQPQIFYYDDFLGRNYLDATAGRQGSAVMQFIKRVSAHGNKKFILTSRSNILNQGRVLVDHFENANLKKNEYEMKMASLSDLDKARILYNHIWFSGLSASYVDELYEDRRYKQVIRHKNFNPRLISFVTDPQRLEDVGANDYWKFIWNSLSDPKLVWEHAFVSQHDDFCRVLVFLAVFNGGPILESDLNSAYERYLSSISGPQLQGLRDFSSNTKILTGTFLNRHLEDQGGVRYNLFNPSIGDYVLARHGGDVRVVGNAVVALRNGSSLSTLISLERDEKISKNGAREILLRALRAIDSSDVNEDRALYFCWVAELYFKRTGVPGEDVRKLLLSVLELAAEHAGCSMDSFAVFERALDLGVVSCSASLAYVSDRIKRVSGDYEISAAASLLSSLEERGCDAEDERSELNGRALSIVADDIESFVDLTDVFAESGPDDFGDVAMAARQAITDKLSDLCLQVDEWEVEDLVDRSSLHSSHYNFHRDNMRDDQEYSSRYSINQPSDPDHEIDDLFHRDR